ncbi:MAG: Stp1/IreP family PP2C-type Ser/Thr phosphatase [Calditrichaeota bacterium]|nr:MAG: Stp1/IreP family PP2C-type Ser/Thr phosphatase [Calditrichota bacterium]
MRRNLSFEFASRSDVGLKRSQNQDACGKFPPDNSDLYSDRGQLFIVADGLGGHRGGQEASRMAVDIVQQTFFSAENLSIIQRLKDALETANNQIYERASKTPDLNGMGTTCTALALSHRKAFIAHVGDSRVYRIHRQKIEQLTQDHSQIAELQREGVLTPEQARFHPQRSILNRALGVQPTVEVDLIENLTLHPDDYFILCTDGLAKVEMEEIKNLILTNPLIQACDKLIQLANDRGGEDNVTVQIIRITGSTTPWDKMLTWIKSIILKIKNS